MPQPGCNPTWCGSTNKYALVDNKHPTRITYRVGCFVWGILGDERVEPAGGHFDIALDQAMLGRLPGHGNRGAGIL